MTQATLAPFPWSEVWGQDTAVETLQQAASDPAALSHAWLITGPPGSGRSTLAYAFAAALIAEHPDDENAMRQVLAGTHPDLTALRTDKVLITIKEARELVARSYFSPSAGRYRVIVVEDADRMTETTSNVLLKAVEEPPERTIWILCAPSEADLLPTIRSRTRSLHLSTPAPADIARLLHERDGIDPEIAERAARLAQSHIGMARRLASDPESLQRRQRTIEIALGIETLGDAMRAASSLVKVAEADAAALTELLDDREREDAMRSLGLASGAAIPPQMRAQMRALEEDQKRRAKRSLSDGIDRILTDLLSLYRDVLLRALYSESGGPDVDFDMVNREHAARIADLAERWGPERALSVVAAVETARERLGRAITPGLVLEAMFATVVASAVAA